MQLLLENKANINVQNKQGWTPLHYAINWRNNYSEFYYSYDINNDFFEDYIIAMKIIQK